MFHVVPKCACYVTRYMIIKGRWRKERRRKRKRRRERGRKSREQTCALGTWMMITIDAHHIRGHLLNMGQEYLVEKRRKERKEKQEGYEEEKGEERGNGKGGS